MIVMNVFYAVTAYPAGVASDRFSRRALLLAGLLMLIAADLVLALATSVWLAFIGAALWGVHMGLTQGLLSKLVADNVPSHLRGTAFGIFNLVSGVALLLASVIAGLLWSHYGAPATFITGACFAMVATVGLLAYQRTKAGQSRS
jgi:MFS family permease